ncbi:MAG TPA: DinB family protein [Terracidiphilus sp.]|nr:DinB family protein [Terracidiphilus sp.]
MTVAISLQELLGWNEESSNFWHAHLAANPGLLELPCDIGGTKSVGEFVRHIWGVDLRWAQRLAGLSETPRELIPNGPLDALFDLHQQAVQIFHQLLIDPSQDWDAGYTLSATWLPAEFRTASRRKVFAHALFHGQRHWAQLATLVRAAGYPSGFRGDLLFSPGLR